MHRTKIMYIEHKPEGVQGEARIGRVTYSKSGSSLYYKDHHYVPLAGKSGVANFEQEETGEEYWISGCKKNGEDSLHPITIHIDEDVRAEYWKDIRSQPGNKHETSYRCIGKYGGDRPSRL